MIDEELVNGLISLRLNSDLSLGADLLLAAAPARIKELLATVSELNTDAQTLLATIDKLRPWTTADGVKVGAGDTVWFILNGKATSDYAENFLWKWASNIDRDCYSTQAALDAAGKGKA